MIGHRRYALVLTHNRPAELRQCLAAIGPQVDHVIVVDNASDPPVAEADIPPEVTSVEVLHIPDQPPNLAQNWNAGFDAVLRPAPLTWDMAVLCDDAIVPAGWMAAVSGAMREHGGVAGCSSPWPEHMVSLRQPIIKKTPDSDIMGRMPGWAFVVAGDAGLRADETMHWWWCDTDLDWQARLAGGMVMIGGFPVPNLRPNDFTVNVPGLAERAGVDGERFAAKWGSRPW